MRIEDIARANELKKDLERIAAFTSPECIVFHSGGERAMIDDDDLDGGIWFAAAEVIIKNLKEQVVRYKQQISHL